MRTNQCKSPNNDGPVNRSRTCPLNVPSTPLRCRNSVVCGSKCVSFVAFRCDNRTVTHLFAVQRETKVSVEDISNLAPVSFSLPQRISSLCWLTTQNGTRCSKLYNYCPVFNLFILKPSSERWTLLQ